MSISFLKPTLIAFSLGLICSNAHAQGLALGMKGGINSANMAVSTANDPDARTRYHLGFYGRMRFPGSLGIQVEIFYSGQGYGLTGTGLLEVNKVDYVSIPVMLQYDVLGIMNVHAGPQLSFLLKAETELNQLGVRDVFDIKDNIDSREFGVVFGAGLSLPMKLELNARYVMGISDINNLSSIAAEFKNRVLQISLHRRVFMVGR